MSRGMSLVEVMVGVALVTIVLMATYSIFVLSQQTQRKINDRAEIVQNERALLDRLARELRQANKVVTSLPANEILFEDGHNNLEDGIIKYLRYYLSGTDLYREIGHYYFPIAPAVYVRHNETDANGYSPTYSTEETKLIGEYISSLSFTGTNSDLTITMTLIKNSQTLTLSTNVSPRNTQ